MGKEVDPIDRDEDIVRMFSFMMKHGYIREAHGFVIGCNLSLRVSDLLRLTFKDFEDARLNNNTLVILEKKTGKAKVMTINEIVYEHVQLLKQHYRSLNKEPHYVFQATSRNISTTIKAISASWFNRVISEAGEGIMLAYNVGTHTMRKTWGWRAYRDGMDIRKIQKVLNHASPTTTLSYIGFTKRSIAEAYVDNGFSVLDKI